MLTISCFSRVKYFAFAIITILFAIKMQRIWRSVEPANCFLFVYRKAVWMKYSEDKWWVAESKESSRRAKWILLLSFRSFWHALTCSTRISTVIVGIQGWQLKITFGPVCELHRCVSWETFCEFTVTETKLYTFTIRLLKNRHVEQAKAVMRAQSNGTATNAGNEIRHLTPATYTVVSHERVFVSMFLLTSNTAS